jgi:hypothetical protein
MRIDERMEALTQSVELMAELLAHMQLSTEKRMNEGFSRVEKMIESLITVMESHERRLNDLEGGRA